MTVVLVAAYNSTKSYSNYYYGGKYYSYGQLFIPLNYTAANHTIVNTTYSALLAVAPGTFSHTDPPVGDIEGTWIMWTGNWNIDGSMREEFIYNKRGVKIISRTYTNGTYGWQLVMEQVLESAITQESMLMLMLAFVLGGGTGTDNIPIIATIVGVAAVIGVVIVIVVVKKYK